MKPAVLRSRRTKIDMLNLLMEALTCIDHPKALATYMRIKYRVSDLEESLKFVATLYNDPADAALALLSGELVRKFSGLPGSSVADRKAKTLANDLMSEVACRLTNDRLRSGRFTLEQMKLICNVQRRIQSIIGPFCPLKKWVDKCDWGPGATSTLKGDDVVLDNKYLEGTLSVTHRALPYAKLALGEDIHWASARFGAEGPCCWLDTEFSVVDHNRMVLVPKDAFKDRSICAEPTLNIFLQKGVGAVLREKLRSVGCDLNDQTRNQRLARAAFKRGLATLDLESASDTLSIETVHLLLPPEWAELLSALRTPCTILPDGSIRRNEKFSSMGNGFTFELESLIFFAIASECSEIASVYGDDIIVAACDSEKTIQALEFFGFKVNSRKTHISGQYYESCGEHYFSGRRITPVYQKSVATNEVELVRFHNRLHRYLDGYGAYLFNRLLSRLKRLSDVRIPIGMEGDDGMLTSEPLTRYVHINTQQLCYELWVFKTTPIRNRFYHPSVYLASWYRRPACTSDGPISNGIPFRDAVAVSKELRQVPVQ